MSLNSKEILITPDNSALKGLRTNTMTKNPDFLSQLKLK